MVQKLRCRQCNADLPHRGEPRGRPRLFCFTSCRRSFGNEFRRANRRLARMRVLVNTLRTAIAANDDMYVQGWGSPVDALPVAQKELARLENIIGGWNE